MPTITLPDGKTLSFPAPVSGRTIAETISPGLAHHTPTDYIISMDIAAMRPT